jgi:hypothetical protein
MKTLSLLTGCAIGLTLATDANAQARRIVANDVGNLYRFTRDTLWYERDTTVMRYVYRGDTIFTERTLNDRRVASWVQVVVGDSIRYLSYDDPADPVRRAGTAVHVRGGTYPRSMVISSLQMNETRASMAARGVGTMVPRMPAEEQSYCIDGSRKMTQRGDTVRDIRVLPGRTDTTVYLFIGDTTVQRVSPAPRTFGYGLRQALHGDMYMSLSQRSMAQRTTPFDTMVPGKNYDRCNPARR